MKLTGDLEGCAISGQPLQDSKEKHETATLFNISDIIADLIGHFVETYNAYIIESMLENPENCKDDKDAYEKKEDRIKYRIRCKKWQEKMLKKRESKYFLANLSIAANLCVQDLHDLCGDLTSIQLRKNFKAIHPLGYYAPRQSFVEITNFKDAIPNLKNRGDNFSGYLHKGQLTSSNVIEVFSTLLEMDDVATLHEYEPLIQRNVQVTRQSLCKYTIKLDAGTPANFKDIITPNLDEVVLLPIKKHSAVSREANTKKFQYFQEVSQKDAKSIFATVFEITKDAVCFTFDKPRSLKEDSTLFDLVFRPSRFPIRYQYRALRLLFLSSDMRNYLFPEHNEAHKSEWQKMKQGTDLKLINPTIANNPEQLEAVQNITTDRCRTAPYIIFGPPGTGKTTTIVESILQLRLQQPESCILVTAGSNSACDTIAIRICKYYKSNPVLVESMDGAEILPMIRIYSKSILQRGIEKIPNDLLKCSNVKWNQGAHAYPAVEDIHKYGIVVATLCTVGKLVTGDIGYRVSQNHFTHVFIDEVAASTEPEALIGIMGIKHRYDDNCQVILSGDHKQLGAVLKSDEAAELGLGESLMERLLKRPCYALDSNGNYDRTLQIRLLRNYRSHPEIVGLYNSLYYNNELLAMIDGNTNTNMNRKWSFLPNPSFPIVFQAVHGNTSHEDTTSSCNFLEISVLIWYIRRLVDVDEVKEGDIGIIAPYRLQCVHIQSRLRSCGYPNIEVGSVENFQGCEKEVIVISMVRSFASLGFLKNERRLNVMLSRAKSLLLILGNPLTLRRFKDIDYIIKECMAKGTYLRKKKDKSKRNRKPLEVKSATKESLTKRKVKVIPISSSSNKENDQNIGNALKKLSDFLHELNLK